MDVLRQDIYFVHVIFRARNDYLMGTDQCLLTSPHISDTCGVGRGYDIRDDTERLTFARKPAYKLAG